MASKEKPFRNYVGGQELFDGKFFKNHYLIKLEKLKIIIKASAENI